MLTLNYYTEKLLGTTFQEFLSTSNYSNLHLMDDLTNEVDNSAFFKRLYSHLKESGLTLSDNSIHTISDEDRTLINEVISDTLSLEVDAFGTLSENRRNLTVKAINEYLEKQGLYIVRNHELSEEEGKAVAVRIYAATGNLVIPPVSMHNGMNTLRTVDGKEFSVIVAKGELLLPRKALAVYSDEKSQITTVESKDAGNIDWYDCVNFKCNRVVQKGGSIEYATTRETSISEKMREAAAVRAESFNYNLLQTGNKDFTVLLKSFAERFRKLPNKISSVVQDIKVAINSLDDNYLDEIFSIKDQKYEKLGEIINREFQRRVGENPNKYNAFVTRSFKNHLTGKITTEVYNYVTHQCLGTFTAKKDTLLETTGIFGDCYNIKNVTKRLGETVLHPENISAARAESLERIYKKHKNDRALQDTIPARCYMEADGTMHLCVYTGREKGLDRNALVASSLAEAEKRFGAEPYVIHYGKDEIEKFNEKRIRKNSESFEKNGDFTIYYEPKIMLFSSANLPFGEKKPVVRSLESACNPKCIEEIKKVLEHIDDCFGIQDPAKREFIKDHIKESHNESSSFTFSLPGIIREFTIKLRPDGLLSLNRSGDYAVSRDAADIIKHIDRIMESKAEKLAAKMEELHDDDKSVTVSRVPEPDDNDNTKNDALSEEHDFDDVSPEVDDNRKDESESDTLSPEKDRKASEYLIDDDLAEEEYYSTSEDSVKISTDDDSEEMDMDMEAMMSAAEELDEMGLSYEDQGDSEKAQFQHKR